MDYCLYHCISKSELPDFKPFALIIMFTESGVLLGYILSDDSVVFGDAYRVYQNGLTVGIEFNPMDDLQYVGDLSIIGIVRVVGWTFVRIYATNEVENDIIEEQLSIMDDSELTTLKSLHVANEHVYFTYLDRSGFVYYNEVGVLEHFATQEEIISHLENL